MALFPLPFSSLNISTLPYSILYGHYGSHSITKTLNFRTYLVSKFEKKPWNLLYPPLNFEHVMLQKLWKVVLNFYFTNKTLFWVDDHETVTWHHIFALENCQFHLDIFIQKNCNFWLSKYWELVFVKYRGHAIS